MIKIFKISISAMIAAAAGFCTRPAQADEDPGGVYGGFDIRASAIQGEDDVTHWGARVRGKLGGRTNISGVYGYLEGGAYSSEEATLTTSGVGIGAEYMHPSVTAGVFLGYVKTGVEANGGEVDFGKGVEYGAAATLKISESSPVGILLNLSRLQMWPTTEIVSAVGYDPGSFDIIQFSAGMSFEWGGP